MTPGTKILLALWIILQTGILQAQQKDTYNGGMLILQPGFTFTSNKHQDIHDYSFGLGGILRLYLSDRLTTGIYGGTQRTGYISTASDQSTLTLGYGGPFFGYSQRVNRIRYTASLFAGKGTVRNLHVEVQVGNFLAEAYLYEYPVWVFSPILSIDYSLSGRLHLTLQGVCPVTTFEGARHFFNPTLQLGILFGR